MYNTGVPIVFLLLVVIYHNVDSRKIKIVPTNVRTIALFLGINLLEWQIVRRTLASGLLCWWKWRCSC